MLSPAPGVEAFDPFEQGGGCMGALPVAGNVFVGLGQRGIDVDGAEDLVAARCDGFIARTYSAIRSPACSPTIVTPRMRSFLRREDLDEAMRLAVRDGAGRGRRCRK